jgi:hypothetical protein
MTRRFVLPAVLALGCLLGGALACSSPDPGYLEFAERRGTVDPTSTSTSSGGSSSSGGKPDAGATADAGAAGGDLIFGTTTFAYQSPGVTANGEDPAHGGNIEGKDCLLSGCHGTGATKPFLFGGTVYNAASSGQTVAQAEVRLVDVAGKEIATAYTDPNGNFWFDKGALTVPANGKVGARTATKAARMTTALGTAGGGCNAATGCHGGTMRVYVN